MKKRRLAIVAFLLSAILVIGIGYAAVTGTLNITGTAYFHGTGTSGTAINAAVKFTEDIEIDPNNDGVVTASITDQTSFLAADMNVTFNDAVGAAGEDFVATVTFTIEYDDTGAAADMLKDVKFANPNDLANMTSAQGSTAFDIDVAFEGAAPDGTYTLAAGQTVKVTVTVTYTNPAQVATGTVSAAISVPLTYAVVTNE